MKIKDNYTLMCDFYEITMANGYFVNGIKDQICYFDVFYRTTPDNGGFVICAGLEQVIDYINNLHFDEEDIEFLKTQNLGVEDENLTSIINHISYDEEACLKDFKARVKLK